MEDRLPVEGESCTLGGVDGTNEVTGTQVLMIR